jgi:hypothetical protein
MKIALCVTLMLVCLVVATAQRPTQLFGYIRNSDTSPARGVVVSVGNFSVATDDHGKYSLQNVKPGANVVSLTPSGKATRSFRISIGAEPTEKNFTIDW